MRLWDTTFHSEDRYNEQRGATDYCCNAPSVNTASELFAAVHSRPQQIRSRLIGRSPE